jgi:hypothetical protein
VHVTPLRRIAMKTLLVLLAAALVIPASGAAGPP